MIQLTHQRAQDSGLSSVAAKRIQNVDKSNSELPSFQETEWWSILFPVGFEAEIFISKDEAELGKMMGDDGEKLLALVDNIRKIDSLRNEELHIPQIVVIGDTSTGKSSVLQVLTRLPFPFAGDLCTRFVTETTIRQCGPSKRPGYKIEVNMEGPSTSQVAPFPPKSLESEEWVEVYQNLREDINDAFDKMSPTNLLSPGSSKELLKHRLQITVRKRNQAHFSIVDIPGLISSGATVDIQLSVELARQYIKNEEAIVLNRKLTISHDSAITPASNVLINQKWLNLVTIEEADHEIIFNLLRNRVGSEYHLKLGWFAVRNRNSKEVIDRESFEERDMKEDVFFEHGKWKEATLNFPSWDSVDPKVLGIQRLKHSLQDHLYKRVKENFPRLRSKMRSLEIEYNTKIQSMGDPREKPRDQQVYLSGIQTMYETEVERSLNGDYRFVDNPNYLSRLRYHVKMFNGEFESSIQQDAIKYHWQLNDQDDVADGVGIFNWINNTWDVHRGSEPRHDAPRSPKKEPVKQQTESWETKTKLYIQRVEDAIKACNDDLFMFACKDDALRLKIRDKLEARERRAFEDARTELQNTLRDCDYIDSWNPQLEIFIGQCQHPRIERQVKLQLAQQEKGLAAETNPPEALMDQVSAGEKFYIANKRVLKYMTGYWHTGKWRIRDL
ncbi:hypothetical protein G7Y89_g707 [Cudoniella acicularis]|uniref:Dynamin GTPase domain-containing protein n=1 Tax=Cudoniella acicularis TaxID=354080 RepID=A0A8H4RXM5_9HELO|nr:hypothetical protein G7Y89_g707 [Cudoniella acicularis]